VIALTHSTRTVGSIQSVRVLRPEADVVAGLLKAADAPEPCQFIVYRLQRDPAAIIAYNIPMLTVFNRLRFRWASRTNVHWRRLLPASQPRWS